MKFDFSKSNDSDFRNKLSIQKLDILLKNVLYCTHRLDTIVEELKLIKTDKNLQSQVDEYFDESEDSTHDDRSGS